MMAKLNAQRSSFYCTFKRVVFVCLLATVLLVETVLLLFRCSWQFCNGVGDRLFEVGDKTT